jgi:hypothetical protein
LDGLKDGRILCDDVVNFGVSTDLGGIIRRQGILNSGDPAGRNVWPGQGSGSSRSNSAQKHDDGDWYVGLGDKLNDGRVETMGSLSIGSRFEKDNFFFFR